jgi:hydroxyacyl-ACP dehydratase HTD2-like protein with hotdog domain
MAGGKEVEFFKQMRPGDTITRIGKMVDIYEKEGRSGPLVFTVFENRYTNQDGELVAIEKITGIHR